MPPAPLPKDDIVYLNLIAANGVPGLENMDRAHCLRTIDQWASAVASYTNRVAYLFDRNPASYQYCPARFKMEVLVTVLQRDLGVHYRQELIDMPDHDFFKDGRNLFIPGVTSGHGGTCSSLPATFIAMGRRLGYPLKLCHTHRHGFARWEEPGGPRFNIECTSRGFVSQPDEYYLEYAKEMKPELVKRSGFLRSLTPAQEAAAFHGTRGICCSENGDWCTATIAYADAADLDPVPDYYLFCFGQAARRWDEEQKKKLRIGFPALQISRSPRRHPKLLPKAADRVAFLVARQLLLDDPDREARWWGLLRREPGHRPAGLPEMIDVNFNVPNGQPPVITTYDKMPADFDRKTAIRT